MATEAGLQRSQNLAGALFLAPAGIVLLLFIGFPVAAACLTSLTRYDMLTPAQWVGLNNYISIVQSRDFLDALWVTARFVVGASIPILVLSLVLAVLLNHRFKGAQLFKLIIFAPVVLSEAVTAIVWKILLHPYGIINDSLVQLGLSHGYIKWLRDPDYALWGIIFFIIWKETGYFMIIFLTGLQNIPTNLREAAAIDGASDLQIFWKVTLPLLSPTTLFVTIIMMVNLLNTFTPFYVMTRGGPVNSTEVLSLLMYDTGFDFMLMGKASAMSVAMLTMAAIPCALLFGFATKRYRS
jgi:multiple sugar transport system permease protein